MSVLSRPAALTLAMLVATLGALLQAQPVWAQSAKLGSADAQAEPKLFDLVLRTREARLAGDNQAWLENGRRVLAMAPEHPDLLISVGRALAQPDAHPAGEAAVSTPKTFAPSRNLSRARDR